MNMPTRGFGCCVRDRKAAMGLALVFFAWSSAHWLACRRSRTFSDRYVGGMLIANTDSRRPISDGQAWILSLQCTAVRMIDLLDNCFFGAELVKDMQNSTSL